ncbi:MAG TPA: hypothetical protein VGJ33_00530 [Candidatus Angelobacter sp.]|jgi:hypothetical protein
MTTTDDLPHSILEEYVAKADRLSAEIKLRNGDLEPAYQAFDNAIQAMERKGLALESLVPADKEFSLGFAAGNDQTGEGFWKQYKKAIRKRICNPRSPVYKKFASGGSIGAGSLIGLLLKHLGLPVEAIPIAAIVAGILSAAGLDAICIDQQSAPRKRAAKKKATI